MHFNLMMTLRTLLADPDRPDRAALFAVFTDEQVSEVLACLAPPGSLLQIAAALRIGWSWCLAGWERLTDELVHRITDPQCPSPRRMIVTWSDVPDAVSILRDRTDDMITWGQQQFDPWTYDYLATLLGPSDAAARLLLQSPSSDTIGRTLRRWSMAISPDNPTAWQEMIESPDLCAALHQKADPSRAFPAWGWDPSVNPKTVLFILVNDLFDGWSPDHPSIRGRFAWLENHVTPDLHVDDLARAASIGRSDAIADAVCACLGHDPSSIPRIAGIVPWDRLHPRIQTVIDETMRRSSDDRWKRTWACALGKAPIVSDTTIDADLLMWRIAPERWNDLDPSIRAALVPRSSYLPHHCYLVGREFYPYEDVFRFWTPDVPPDDLRAWAYAEILLDQPSRQEAREMIVLLDILPPTRRARFEQIIDGRLGGRLEATSQPPWEWADWIALPAADRQIAIENRLVVLWGDRATLPAVRFWHARNDGLATLALMVGEVLGLDDPPPILAALLAQIPALRGTMTDDGPTLPFPDDLNAALRAQIERLPISPNEQAYAAWCLRLLACAGDMGANLIALHPDVAVALAPLLSPDQQKTVAVSLVAQGWESMTHLRWAAACAAAEEPTTLPIQRRL